MEEEEDNKVYVIEVETIINPTTLSNLSQEAYKRITRIVRGDNNKLEVEIYTEESFSLSPATRSDDYY